MGRVISILAVMLTGAVIALAADLPRRAGLALYAEQYLAALMAIALPLVFLAVPAAGGRKARQGPVPWYDLAAAIAGAAAAAYWAARFPQLSDLVSRRPWDGLAVASVVCLLVLEGLRRSAGGALAVVTAAFFVLALVGGALPGELEARSIPLDRLAFYAVWDSSAMLGVPMKLVATVVTAFVLFGQVLFKSGGAAFFTDLSLALMGRRRGGPAKMAIVGSSLFGTISGSVVANVLTTGVVTIPMMKRAGFQPHVAAAVEATASTGGQLMPPVMGIAAFLMAEFLQVPYAQVALAALIPAVLFYLALFIQIDLHAARAGIRAVDEAQIPRLGAVLKSGWYFPVPFAILIYALFWLNYEPETAALLAAAATLALGIAVPFQGRRVGWRDVLQMLRDTGLSVLELFMIGAAAGVIIGTLSYSGVGFSLTVVLLHASGENLLALLVIAGAASIVLGMGMPTVGVYILLATLIAPALVKMGIDPMAAHMFIMYYGCLSMITPPVAIGAFAAANLAGADPMRTGWTAMAVGWCVFVIPFLFVFSGTLLLKGDPWLIALDVATATAGVWLVSAASAGYAARPLGAPARLVYAAAGLALMLPAGAFAEARWFNVAGALVAIALLLLSRRMHR
ncbi:MAG TPA: TRAP transporter fused permease subunit [Burkholderiales bacterium]|nr:TRAP transporter fused permease subunit [Burkholderiales bacterium]